jgi:hypothetical protein
LSGMIIDRGMEDSFRKSFSKHDSLVVKGILSDVVKLCNDCPR